MKRSAHGGSSASTSSATLTLLVECTTIVETHGIIAGLSISPCSCFIFYKLNRAVNDGRTSARSSVEASKSKPVSFNIDTNNLHHGNSGLLSLLLPLVSAAPKTIT